MSLPLLSMSFPAITSIILSYLIALLAIAFYTLIERKLLGYFQLRKGPNKVGLAGIPQPFADALKLFIKERAIPTTSNIAPFIIAPILRLILALILWTLYPHSTQAFFIIYGALYFLCVSRINVYSTFLAGWCSNSKYALLGALRGVAQTISYEVRISLILLSILCLHITIDFTVINYRILSWLAILVPTIFIIWFITNLAETSRTPFDLTEGESELVSGFNVEYSNGIFALIFIAEYTNILIIRLLTRILLIGMGPIYLDHLWLLTKTVLLSVLFIWVRATLPRIRYDILISLTWKTFLPLILSSLILINIMSKIINSWYNAGWTDNLDVVNYGCAPCICLESLNKHLTFNQEIIKIFLNNGLITSSLFYYYYITSYCFYYRLNFILTYPFRSRKIFTIWVWFWP